MFISLQIEVNINSNINISNLTEAIEKQEINKKMLKMILEKQQEIILARMCGKKYGREGSYEYERKGSSEKTIGTKFGKLKIKLAKVQDIRTGKLIKPLKEKIELKGKKVYQDDVSSVGVDMVTKMTYNDTVDIGKHINKEMPSKFTIRRRVIEYGSEIEDYNKERVADLSYTEADGTKAHGLKKGEKKDINVVLGVNKSNCKELVGITVNRSWKENGEKTNKLTSKVPLISDGEKAIKNALTNKRTPFQLCIEHTISEVSYKLWQQELPKCERDLILDNLKELLYTLKNSVLKHIEDKNFRRLEKRIEETIKELKALAKELKKRKLKKASKFIRNGANSIVTFARLAMKGIKIPWNNNLIERLMGEVAKRVKNKWMHWSDVGLQNLLNLLLVRYTNKKRYLRFWDHVLKREAINYINIRVYPI